MPVRPLGLLNIPATQPSDTEWELRGLSSIDEHHWHVSDFALP
jgi:hypothetical protein